MYVKIKYYISIMNLNCLMFQIQILYKLKHEKKRSVELNTPVSKNGYCNLVSIQLGGQNYISVPQIALGKRDG